MCVRRILRTILGLLVIGAGAALIPNATSALGANQANAQGVALVAQVNDAYKHLPGATLTIHVGVSSEVFTQVLRNGVVVAEQFEGASSAGTTMLVAPHGTPTYAKEPKTSCWRVLTKSDSQTLDDVGHAFLSVLATQKGVTVGSPHSTKDGWTLTLSHDGISLTLTISKASLVEAMTATKAGEPVEHIAVNNLTHVPSLLVPRPLC
jgi:hypothetical protein